MVSNELQLSIRLPSARKPVGLKLLVPRSMTVVPGPEGSSVHAVDCAGPAPAKLTGELDVRVITPGMIMDRDGILREAALHAADAFVAPPRDGWLVHMGEVDLPGGRAWRADAYMNRGAEGRTPVLPYQSVVVMGHPDLIVPLALIVTLHSEGDVWPAGAAFLDSIQFLGVPAASARDALVLPFVS